ncbi:N-acetylmuramoyl-L-alanine amidase [Portibacter lacus]|uniref:N-acetylmuramoyl-L-alanine amidase n=1 Tax=Portibacter lacus TaxID=1099794 RepID=A0AA37SN80_9BACT|nr:N-acetylmuramoyl-L-alanine amidase [Portibacter lacus]GLR16772.1 hypothetical protein GCM10007940_13870 [Portibacter lacus]
MKLFKLYLVIILAGVCTSLSAQLEGTRICLDPGHGGHDSNDRETELGIDTLYYESDANWDAVLHMERLLKNLGAEVKVTRTTNDPDAEDRDPSLADRVQVGNAFNADYFHSFHTNGFSNPDINYTLILYPGPEDGTADFPESLVMGEYMSVELYKYMKTKSTSYRADIPFTGFTNGLGVLNGLNMPGTLSEASFHSNINEGRRLMNTHYRLGAAYGLTKSFLQYFEKDSLPTGELGGAVTDSQGNPLNDVQVTFNAGTDDEKTYTTDQFKNGFYFFDSIAPGDYDVIVEKTDYDTQELTITVKKGEYTEADVTLIRFGNPPSDPHLTSIQTVADGDGVYASWLANPETTFGGYRLYYATNDDMDTWALAADESTLTIETTEISIANQADFVDVPEGPVNHFRLVGVSVTGEESGYGDIYSKSSNNDGPKVLIIDGFDRISGSYKETTHNFVTGYLIGLRNSQELDISSMENEKVAEDSTILNQYDLIVWFVGDDSTVDETFSTKEQGYIKSYLNNGGHLVASGSEIGWDLDNKGSEDDKAFVNDYLKVDYAGDGSVDYTPATGIDSTVFEGVLVQFGLIYVEDYPDEFNPVEGATALMKYKDPGGTAAVGYKGVFPEGTTAGGVVTMGITLESALVEDQEDLLGQILIYFGIGEDVVSTDDLALSHNVDLAVKPNPSSNGAILTLTSPNTILDQVQLTAVNINGEIILNKSIHMNSNSRTIALPSEQWPAGTYFLSVASENDINTLLFIKL